MIAGAPGQFHFFRNIEEIKGIACKTPCSVQSCVCASLSLSTSGGKSIVKFTLETPPPPVTTTSSRSPTSPSAPGNPFGGRVSSGRGKKRLGGNMHPQNGDIGGTWQAVWRVRITQLTSCALWAYPIISLGGRRRHDNSCGN